MSADEVCLFQIHISSIYNNVLLHAVNNGVHSFFSIWFRFIAVAHPAHNLLSRVVGVISGYFFMTHRHRISVIYLPKRCLDDLIYMFEFRKLFRTRTRVCGR